MYFASILYLLLRLPVLNILIIFKIRFYLNIYIFFQPIHFISFHFISFYSLIIHNLSPYTLGLHCHESQCGFFSRLINFNFYKAYIYYLIPFKSFHPTHSLHLFIHNISFLIPHFMKATVAPLLLPLPLHFSLSWWKQQVCMHNFLLYILFIHSFVSQTAAGITRPLRNS